MIKDIRATISYSCVQVSFWMSLCIFMGFAAVYLQSLGYSNGDLGVILAVGTLLGSLAGPVLSSLIDRSAEDRITASSMMPPVIAAEAAATAVLLLFPVKGTATTVAFAMYIALATPVNSLILKLYTDSERLGLDIDYGITRGIGSLGYVAASFVVGALCESISPRAVPAAGLAVCAIQISAFLYFSGCMKAARRRVSSEGNDVPNAPALSESHKQKTSGGNAVQSSSGQSVSEGETGTTIAAFLLRNRRFCLILSGTMLIFFSHNTLCNFFINVVRNVGGGTGEMGFLNGLMALIEIPVLLFYTRLTRRSRTSSVLKVAFIFFTAKAAAIAAAGSVASLAGSLLLQAPSFGLYTGAIVLYIDMVIDHRDSGKAQSLAFSVTMLGSVLASTVSGRLFDMMSVSSVMWIACAVCAAGSLLAFTGVQDTRR